MTLTIKTQADSAWDKTPKDYEGASAARAKASGLFPVPGATVKKTLDSAEVKRILNKKKTNRAISVAQTELTPARSRNSTRLIVSGVDFEKISPQQIQKHFEGFIVSSIIPNVEYEDFNLNTYLTPDKTKLIVETSKSLVATALTGLSDRTIPELDVTPHIERPHNYIVLDDQHEADPNEIVDEIIESPNLFGLQNIPFGTSREQLIEVLSEFGDIESLSVILDKLSYESKGIAFFEYRELKVSPEELIDSLSKKEIDSNNLSCYRACQNIVNHYQQSVDITADTLFDFTDKKTDNITRQKPGTVIQFLNCLSFDDLLNPTKYSSIYESFKSECSTFGEVQELRIPKPEAGFKEHSDEMKPEYGKIYVKFSASQDASACLYGLCGRMFTGRIVIGSYVDEFDFENGLL
ncbi:unnamed protein product [Ambrosiozyma monospora]|uniref:Unnamed protein product n=1 Tax=Ambrosiozyma monospora TaxID=43982 RepID=A0ACB5TBX1_AMBMO|nr:unnamed protein product [Ambrosiozyma monospora]